MLLAPRLRGRYAAGTLSVLWLVLALWMALPVPLSLPWTAVTVDVSALSSVTLPAAPRAPAEVPEPAGPESGTAPGGTPAAAPEGRPLPLLELAAWVWLAGGLALVGYQGAAYLLARRRLLRARSRARRRRGPNWRPGAELGLRRTPRLQGQGGGRPSGGGTWEAGASAAGQALPADEREVVLLHELTHLRRHDLAHKALLFVPCAVHWFNPLVWWMAREAGRTLELCCDARVVRGRDEAFRRRYGTALLHLAAGGRGPVLSTRFGGEDGCCGRGWRICSSTGEGGGGGRPRAGCRPGRHLTGGL
ncbi:MAG: M56 family metallopeptidase [Dysosmobacter welbionis]